MLLYVKSGDTVLARLPLVPGLNEVDVADLPSDVRRLEAEAMLKGFQSDILDQIGQRAIISARVSRYLKEGKFKEVDEVIDQLSSLPSYKVMSDRLTAIQQRVLDESVEAVPMAAKSRIDRMTQSTRDMLQKYLDNDLRDKLLQDLKAAQAAAAAAPAAPTPQPSAPATAPAN